MTRSRWAFAQEFHGDETRTLWRKSADHFLDDEIRVWGPYRAPHMALEFARKLHSLLRACVIDSLLNQSTTCAIESETGR
jgi:hypothetical protein